MKSRRLFFKAAAVLLTALTLLMVTGCNNIAANVSGKTEMAKIVLSVGKVGRTINPTVTKDMLTDLVLTAQKENSEAKQIGNWTAYSKMAGTEIELEAGSYTFTLTAKKGGTSFSGSTQHELSVDTTTPLSFELSITDIGSPEEKGSLDVKFYYKDSGLDFGYVFLYDINDCVYHTLFENDLLEDGTGEYEGYKLYHLVKENLPVGMYTLTFEVQGNRNVAWNDNMIYVSADLTSQKTFVINEFIPVYHITYDYQMEGVEDEEKLFVISLTDLGVKSVNDNDFPGYRFLGWYRDELCSGEEVTFIDCMAESGDITLYAKWEETPVNPPVEPPTTATPTINVLFQPDYSIRITKTENNGVITLEAEEGFDSYVWTINQVTYSDQRTITLENLPLGTYIFTLVSYKDHMSDPYGGLYIEYITVEVTE